MINIKHIIAAFAGIALALLFKGCSAEAFNISEAGKDGLITVTFMADMAPQKEVKLGTRAVDDAASVQHLFLFVFDEEGLYMETVKATVSGDSQEINGNTFYAYRATLRASDKKRIIHFIGTNEDELIEQYITPELQKHNKGKSEGELMPSFVTDKHVFWHRQEYASAFSGNAVTLQPISLIRNFARISIVNAAPSSHDFTLTGYAIHNKAQKATVAPFNNISYTFELNRVTEPPKVPYLPLNAATLTFTPAAEATDLFERLASFKESPFYILLNSNKGFYKIRLQDTDKLELLPVIRNHHYVITITSVLKNGYATALEAMNNPAAENTSLSVALADYPKISDGKSTLEVDKIAFFYTEGGLDFKANYIYKPDVSNPTAVNAPIEVSLRQESTRKVLDPSSIEFNTTEQPTTHIKLGTVTGKVVAVMPNPGDIYTAIVRVRAGSLMREIKVFLSHKQEYPIAPTLTSHGDNAGDRVEIAFNIPENAFSPSFYPMEFLIDSKFLNPRLDTGYNSNLTVINDGSGNFKYKYKALGPGNQTIYMKRNQSNKTEEVLLSSQYYETAVLKLELQNPSNGVVFTHFRGKLEYRRGNGSILPVQYGSELIAYPVSTSTNFRLEESGRYVFDLHPNEPNSYSATFKVILSDGRYYRTEKTKAALSSNPNILLESYTEKSGGFVYKGNTSAYLTENGTFTSSVTGVSLTKYPTDNRGYEATINSDIPDNQTVQLVFTVSGTGEKLIGSATVKELRMGKSLMMKGSAVFKMRFSRLQGGSNTALTGATVSSNNSGVTVAYSGEEYDYDLQAYIHIYHVTVGSTVANTEWITFSSGGYSAVVQVGTFENLKQIRLRAANPGTSTKTLSNTLWFYNNDWYYVPAGTAISVMATGINAVFNGPQLQATVPTAGSLRITYPNDMPDDTTLKLSITVSGIPYTGTTTLSNIKAVSPSYIGLLYR